MIAWLRRALLVMLFSGGLVVTQSATLLAQDAPEVPVEEPPARRPAAAAPARRAPRAATPAPAPAPQRELVYVVIGREPTGDPSALLRALEAVLGEGRAATTSAPATAPEAGALAVPVAPAPGVGVATTPPESSAAPAVVTDESSIEESAGESEPAVEWPADAEIDPAEGAESSAGPDETALAIAETPAPRQWQEMGFVPWTLLGVGAAGMVGGALTGGLVLESRSELDAMCMDGVCTGDAAEALGRANTMADASTALLIGGGASLAAGLLWLLIADLTGGDDDSASELPSAALSCDGSGCLAQLGTRF